MKTKVLLQDMVIQPGPEDTLEIRVYWDNNRAHGVRIIRPRDANTLSEGLLRLYHLIKSDPDML